MIVSLDLLMLVVSNPCDSQHEFKGLNSRRVVTDSHQVLSNLKVHIHEILQLVSIICQVAEEVLHVERFGLLSELNAKVGENAVRLDDHLVIY